MSSPFRVAAVGPVAFLRWRLKLWGAREGLFCCWNVVKGGVGVYSMGSRAKCWFSLKP